MSNKRKVCELAMQILFVWDAHAQDDAAMAAQVTHDNSDDPVTRQQALDMARGAWEQRATIDQWIERLAPQWPPRRQPWVDRNLLRLAVWELTNTATPPKVVLDEAIEMAKEYSTEQSSSFVNGVLDAILKEHKTLTQGVLTPPTPASERT